MADIVDPKVEQYALEHTTPEPDYLQELADETRANTDAPQMMVGALEGQLLAALVAMLRPKLVLEIGTFTGYSALTMAAALPPEGRIITCDISERHLEIARRHIARSPHADRIDIRLGPALDTVGTLPGPFDLVFIDADKPSYPAYYEAVLPKLAPDGVIIVDNVLWSGEVVDGAGGDDTNLAAIRELNDRVATDERVECVMLTVRDGVSLIRRRSSAR